MKKSAILLTSIICSLTVFSQNNHVNSILIRHDTTLLNAEACEWVVKSLIKNDTALTAEIGKSIPLILLQAVENGNIKAIDPETNKPIPAKEIFTWGMPADTIPVYDSTGEVIAYQTLQREHSPDYFKQLRVFQDWYFDVATGSFYSQIKWIELMEDISSAQGIYLGKSPLFRIYY